MTDLDVAFELETAIGWVQLEDFENGYELHREAFSTKSVSHRKTEVPGEWIEGTPVSRSLRDSIVEDLSVWVGGETHFVMRERLKVITDALESLSYRARYRVEDYQETWTCTPADYTLESEQAFVVAKVVLVRAKVPRYPSALIEQVTP